MKKLSCKDVNPDTGCSFEATGNTAKEVVNKMMAHVKQEHSGEMEGMSDADLRTMLEAKVHE